MRERFNDYADKATEGYRSAYNTAREYPGTIAALIVGVGVTAFLLWAARRLGTPLRERVTGQEMVDRIAQLDVTLPAEESQAETPHGQNLVVVQAIQHGIDHRTQICTGLTARSLSSLCWRQLSSWGLWPSGIFQVDDLCRSTSN